MIKIAVDIRRRMLAGGGEMHARPKMGNRSTLIQSEELRQQVASVAIEILEDIHAAE